MDFDDVKWFISSTLWHLLDVIMRATFRHPVYVPNQWRNLGVNYMMNENYNWFNNVYHNWLKENKIRCFASTLSYSPTWEYRFLSKHSAAYFKLVWHDRLP